MDFEEFQATDDVGREPGGARTCRDEAREAVFLWGEHDVATKDLVEKALVEAIASDANVVVDLADVGFLDASILGTLVRSRELLRSRDRVLSVRSPRRFQRRILDVCGLSELIEDPEDAPPDGRNARTALETWVEVPTAGRPARQPADPPADDSTHPGGLPAQHDPEASRG